MTDLADRAHLREQEFITDALAAHQRRSALDGGEPILGYTRIQCRDCDEPIAQARQAAIPHVQRCTDCQTIAEHEQRLRKFNP